MTESCSKPRLLLIGHTYMVAVNREKAKALSEFYEVRVCTIDSDNWIVFGKQVEDIEDPDHAAAYELKRLKRWPETQKFTLLILRGLGREIRDFQPDIILVENEPWSLLRWQTRLLAKFSAPRAIFAEFTWENVPRSGIKGFLFKLCYRAAAATADRVICGNIAAANFFRDAGLDTSRIHVDGQLGILESDYPIATKDEKRAWRRSLDWPEDCHVIGYCGRLVEEKGLRELVEATRQLRTDFPNLRLALLGRGPMEIELQALDPDSEWLYILPPVPHREVCNFLNKLDIFVLPSKPLNHGGKHWEEQFGHVLIEAIVAGILTIGSDSGAIPEVLCDPEVTFPHSNTNALLAILRRTLENPVSTEMKKIEQRKHCLHHWNHRSLAMRYKQFFGK